MRVKRYFAPLIIYMTKVVRREQIYLGGAGGEYTLVFATLCSQDTVRIMPYRFSMADETVATRLPWLDSSLPGFHAGAFLVFLGIIQQYLSSFAMRSHESVLATCATELHLLTPAIYHGCNNTPHLVILKYSK